MKMRVTLTLLAVALLATALAGWSHWGERLFVAGLGTLC